MRRPALQGAVLDLDLSSFRLDARHRRALQDFLKGLVGHVARGGAHDAPLILLHDNVLRQLKAWSTASYGLRLSARLAAPRAASLPPFSTCCARRCSARPGAWTATSADVDLTAAWPDLDLSFLSRLPVIPATKARLDARAQGERRGRSLAGDHPRPARRRYALRHRRVGAQAARLHARRHGNRQVDPHAQHDRPGHAGRPRGDLDRSAWRPLGEGAEAGAARAAQRPRAGASDRRARRLHHEHPRAARRRRRGRARPRSSASCSTSSSAASGGRSRKRSVRCSRTTSATACSCC